MKNIKVHMKLEENEKRRINGIHNTYVQIARRYNVQTDHSRTEVNLLLEFVSRIGNGHNFRFGLVSGVRVGVSLPSKFGSKLRLSCGLEYYFNIISHCYYCNAMLLTAQLTPDARLAKPSQWQIFAKMIYVKYENQQA
uniref:Uncharacterized protein n=1 Tax=Glossina pallidipes TaxID=7398 RepID=A0A1A9Z693_GLOPL